jgi:hypothetical protein
LNKLQHLNKTFVQLKTNEITAKISYKHMQKIEFSYLTETTVSSDCEKYFWFGAYDKHINLNNLLKVLQFYTDESANKIVK